MVVTHEVRVIEVREVVYHISRHEDEDPSVIEDMVRQGDAGPHMSLDECKVTGRFIGRLTLTNKVM